MKSDNIIIYTEPRQTGPKFLGNHSFLPKMYTVLKPRKITAPLKVESLVIEESKVEVIPEVVKQPETTNKKAKKTKKSKD